MCEWRGKVKVSGYSDGKIPGERGVQLHRQSLGIPAFVQVRRPWTAREDALLGVVPDRELAKKLGIPNPASKRKSWKPEETQLLGTRPDKEIAAQLGCPIRTVTTKRINLGIRAYL